MDRLCAFVDECGNHSLDLSKSGTSGYFILVAVVVPQSKVKKLEGNVKAIIKSLFNNSEMKSSKIGNNHERRKVVLNRILHLDFKYGSCQHSCHI